MSQRYTYFLLFMAVVLFSGFQVKFSAEKISAVNQLSFMEGQWQGQGWIRGRGNVVKRFSQTESIKSKADSKAFVVDGLGYEIDSTGKLTDRVVHNAFGVLSFNPDRGTVTMLSFSENQGRLESDMMLMGAKKLQWSFKEERSGGTIRFTEDFSEAGKWKQKGEISFNNKDWHPFFEMNLTKK